MARLSHLDRHGQARMVDVDAKPVTHRVAIAQGAIKMRPATMRAIVGRSVPKGEVLAVARVAGIMAAKRCGELIPLCHPLGIDSVEVSFDWSSPAGQRGEHTSLLIRATARIRARTGVEMEALTAVAVAALTIYDMCKAIDRTMEIGGIRLIRKTGGTGR